MGVVAAGPQSSELCLWLCYFDLLPGKPGRSGRLQPSHGAEQGACGAGSNVPLPPSSLPTLGRPALLLRPFTFVCIGLLKNVGSSAKS
jgi:hypothetical protein